MYTLAGFFLLIFFGCDPSLVRSFQIARISKRPTANVLKATNGPTGFDRRTFVGTVGLASLYFSQVKEAKAMGLVKFPCESGFGNTYHFLRVGESRMEQQNVLLTNPLFLTNREDSLSDTGIQQIADACELMKLKGINPTSGRHSLAAKSIDTARIVGQQLGMSRDRLLPEYTNLDPRGLGKWDLLRISETEAAIWAMDADEAGKFGKGGKPPPNDDSTPHETLADQAIRLRQLLSGLETLQSGDSILIIFPDGTGPALLSALIAGVPLDRVHELEFQPGEVRFNISFDSVWKQLETRPYPGYSDILAKGRKQLEDLRATDTIVNVKDEQDAIALAKQADEMEAKRMKLEKERELRETKRRERKAEIARAKEAREAEIARAKREPGNKSESGGEEFGSISIIDTKTQLGLVGLTGLALSVKSLMPTEETAEPQAVVVAEPIVTNESPKEEKTTMSSMPETMKEIPPKTHQYRTMIEAMDGEQGTVVRRSESVRLSQPGAEAVKPNAVPQASLQDQGTKEKSRTEIFEELAEMDPADAYLHILAEIRQEALEADAI